MTSPLILLYRRRIWVQCIAITLSQAIISSYFRLKASARLFNLPTRYMSLKQYWERYSAYQAYLTKSFLVIIKYSRARQSKQIRNSASQSPSSSIHYSLRERIIASISLSQILQFNSASYIVLEKNATRYQSSVQGSYYKSIPITTLLDISVSTIVGRSGLQ